MPSLEQLLGGRPDGPEVDVAALAQRVAASGRVLLVLDDDPTGTQSVADLPVLMDWSPESLGWALDQGRPAVYVMTNTRSLDPAEAEQRNVEVARNALAAAAERGTELCFVSRSDSTLRGHFPLETDVLAREIEAVTGRAVDGVLLVPAFGDAGRVTVDGVHYTGAPGGFVPVGESEFARDATFGYASSDLRDWVAEKSEGQIPAEDVAAIDLTTLRTARTEVVQVLRSLHEGRPVVVDIVTENDLRLLAQAVLDAEDAGSVFLVRAGPPFPRALVGQAPHPPLRADDLAAIRRGGLAEDARGGLVVVGSHVALTTSQLEALVTRRDPVRIELDVAAVLGDGVDGYVSDVAARAAEALAEEDVVVNTSRLRVDGVSRDESLAIARRVSTALIEVVQQVLAVRAPRFVVAKGGITSSDVAARGLGITRAMVRGPMLPGIVSLWEPAGGPARGIPYVVFAGNVGGPESLADVVDLLAADHTTVSPKENRP
ncbi:four-carbon acid sugar kinase family protein [uncultured Friedmanniella sp.]|uniref:four-carbon acid sugar kinase family protein n=1 Tax=uncultured Friedmanniella sp. TaxID=335381 RepID=UPI0035CAE63F